MVLIVFTFIGSYFAYLRLPQKVASHWNAQGQVDGYSGQFSGAFFLPIILICLYLLFLVLPKIDPKKANFTKFKDVYYSFITVFILYMIYIHGLTLAYNLGFQFDFVRAIVPSFALLYYFIGWMLPQAKPNWFMGIRTPWTLSSDEVWTKTHILAGKLFKASALLSLMGLLFFDFAIYFVIVPILASSFYLVIYSYIKFSKLKD